MNEAMMMKVIEINGEATRCEVAGWGCWVIAWFDGNGWWLALGVVFLFLGWLYRRKLRRLREELEGKEEG